ncbi:MAG: hypothetical protein ACT6RN_27725 [Agrobacterium sp.]
MKTAIKQGRKWKKNEKNRQEIYLNSSENKTYIGEAFATNIFKYKNKNG